MQGDESDINNDLNGSYLVYDSRRNLLFRSRMAEVGMARRWKEYVGESIQTNYIHQSNKFYSAYHNTACVEANMPSKYKQQ